MSDNEFVGLAAAVTGGAVYVGYSLADLVLAARRRRRPPDLDVELVDAGVSPAAIDEEA